MTSAASSRATSIALVNSIAHAVAPGTPVTAFLPDDASIACEPPRQGQVYFTLFRQFNAPRGFSGSAFVDRIGDRFVREGFSMSATHRVGSGLVRSGQTRSEGVVIRGESQKRTITITVDTACGPP